MSNTGTEARVRESAQFSQLSLSARAVWSKSSPDDAEGHGLLAHLLDVAAVGEVLLAHEPPSSLEWASSVLGVPACDSARWLAALAGLHDYGKAIPGFISKWEYGRQRTAAAALDFSATACDRTNHSLATDALLAADLCQLISADRLWVNDIVAAIAAHHGRYFSASERNQGAPINEGARWKTARQEILACYWATLAPKGQPEPVVIDLYASNWLAGLTSAADWIASNPDWFPLGERQDNLSAYFAHAKKLAENALAQINWPTFRPLQETPVSTADILQRILGKEAPPRPLQTAGDTLLLQAEGPTLLLVEAPMGEGKTELAYLAYLRLQARNAHRGLYIALPTQATGNALFKRTQDFLRAFVARRTDVQLIHGGAADNEQFLHLRQIGDDVRETLAASAWFSQRRRPLLSAYGVGTVDQALLAVLNVKHHFVRVWGLANRVVVLDEVHAYDTYTGVLIEALVRWLKALGSSVILMSATLPAAKAGRLVDAWGGSATDDVIAYPRIRQVDSNGVTQGVHVATRSQMPIALHGIDESIESVAATAIQVLSDGGCGAVIVNTVDRAQALYQVLVNEPALHDLRIVLFHARFPADQRSDIEAEVLSLFGHPGLKNSVRPGAGLLIATQVAEQSLDLDFDFMISDLAPIDLLLQRAGRMHRHVRERPEAHSHPRFWVAGLHGERLPSLKETAWEYVYDAYVLGLTWACLRDCGAIRLPDDIDPLVQWVYGQPTLPTDIGDKIETFINIDSFGAHLGTERAKFQNAVDISLDEDEEVARAYQDKPFGSDDEEGMRNVTRLGPDSVSLVPVTARDGQWWIGDSVIDPDMVPDDETAKTLYRRRLRVSRKAVVVACQQAEQPVAFAEHPVLRHLYPMPLLDGRCEIGGQGLILDRQLGLVYEASR